MSDAVRRQAERMQVLYEASHAFAEEVGDPDRLVQTVARACSRLVGDYCSVVLLRDNGEMMDLAAVYHPDPKLQDEFQALARAIPARVGEGVMGKVVQENRPLLLPEVDPETIVARAPEGYKEIARRLKVHSFIGVPMHARGRVIGGISMARSRAGAAYSQDDVVLLQDLADRAALAIENANLYASLGERVAEATTQLKAANQQLLETNSSLESEIAERKRTEQALRAAREKAEDANRELEAFSYSVAHDLRAPLRSIDGFSGLVLEEYHEKLDADGKRYLTRVREAAQEMGRLIEDLLNLSRVTKAEFRRQRVDLSELAKGVVARLRDTQPGRAIESVVQEGLVGEGDPRLLDVVLTNLIGNAWKFTGKHPAAKIEFAAKSDEPRTYYIRDNGAGFDARYADKLFGVFQRLHTSEEFDGTGIGLATVQRIVRRHGGRIWAEGEVNRGATFYFTIEQGIAP